MESAKYKKNSVLTKTATFVKEKAIICGGTDFCIYLHSNPSGLRKMSPKSGEMSEWLKEPASKTGVRQRTGGSNPSLTAITVDFQPITSFTHNLTHRKAKFVRIFFVLYRPELYDTKM